jgi:uracil-DNA glycosylase
MILPDFGNIDSNEQFDRIEANRYALEFEEIGREPNRTEIQACSPHITELEKEYHPQGIVFLGVVAQKAKITSNCPTLILLNPAAIAREEYKVLPMKKQARKLEKFIHEIRNSTNN